MDGSLTRKHLSIIIVIVSFQTVRSVPEFRFPKMAWFACDTIDTPYITRYNLSVLTCVIECARRARCFAASYNRQRTKCDLYSIEPTWTSISMQTRTCVYILNSDILIPEDYIKNCQECSINQACARDGYSCINEECIPLDLENVELLGNMNVIGATARIEPHDGYELTSNSSVLKCGEDGFWNDSPTIKVTCPVGWLETNNSCYLFMEKLFTHDDATIFCSSHSAHLVTIETVDESDYLDRVLSDYSNQPGWWMGIDDKVEEGSWVYSHTNESITFARWAPGEPNKGHGSEKCVKISGSGYEWMDLRCGTRLNIICEKKLKT